MNGSGCNTCPVKGCDTMNYRGSRCAALRHQHGLGDPMTNADRIRAMSNEELAKFLERSTGGCETCATVCTCNGPEDLPPTSVCHQGVLKWLQQPAKEE